MYRTPPLGRMAASGRGSITRIEGQVISGSRKALRRIQARLRPEIGTSIPVIPPSDPTPARLLEPPSHVFVRGGLTGSFVPLEGRIGGQVIGDAVTRLAIPSHRLGPVAASGGDIARIEGRADRGTGHWSATSVFPAGADLGAYRRWGNRGTGHWSAITQIEGQVNCTARPHWVGWPHPGEGQIEGQAR